VFYADADGVYMPNVRVGKITFDAMDEPFTLNSQINADSGYQELPGGLILQWGKVRGYFSGGLFPITFANPYTQALFTAHFTENRNLTDAGVLTAAAEAAGLDRAEAGEVLASGRYAQAVRAEEDLWRARGINSVPAVVVENKYMISGGQPAEVFEQALRQIAGEA
jgi:hypothetical protein